MTSAGSLNARRLQVKKTRKIFHDIFYGGGCAHMCVYNTEQIFYYQQLPKLSTP